MNFLYKSKVVFHGLDMQTCARVLFVFFHSCSMRCSRGLRVETGKKMGSHWRSSKMVMGFMMVVVMMGVGTEGVVPPDTWKNITEINKEGEHVGIVASSVPQLHRLLDSPSFLVDPDMPYLDYAGRRFHKGTLEKERVIVVATGQAMLNAGITTQLLVNLFNISRVLDYGLAVNANPEFQIGDVTVPKEWAHSGLWCWQRFGEDGELAFESDGNCTWGYGPLNIYDYNIPQSGTTNSLNRVWYREEEVFPVNGEVEVGQHVFWVQVDDYLYKVAKEIEDVVLKPCVNETTPIAKTVERGVSANVYVDNANYSQFLYSNFSATPIDMESAAVALICYQQRTPFIAIRALSDSACTEVAVDNVVAAVIKFMAHLYSGSLISSHSSGFVE